MIKQIILFNFLFLFVSCQSLGPVSGTNERVRKQWVVNTLADNFFTHKVDQKSAAVITDDLVIQGDALYGIRAYDRLYGNLQWFFAVSGGVEGGIYATPKRLFFGGSDGFFYSLEKETGRVLWKFFTGSQNLGEPFVYGKTVYFLTSKEKVYALDSQTGKTLWVYNRPAAEMSSLSIRGVSSPYVDEKNIYVGFQDGAFIALRKKTGQWIWKIRLSKQTDFFKDSDSKPLVTGHLIYISSYSGGLFCLNKNTGKILWKNDKGSADRPAVDGRFLYYSSSDNKVTALDRFSGKEIWSKKVKSLATSPVVYGKTLIYGLSAGGLEFRDKKDGELSYTLNLFKGIAARPTLNSTEKELYVMSAQAWLYKLKLLF